MISNAFETKIMLLLAALLTFLSLPVAIVNAAAPVVLDLSTPGLITLRNGILNLTLSSLGNVHSVSYASISNVFVEKPANFTGLDPGPFGGKPGDRGYYDCNAANNLTGSGYDRFSATRMKVDKQIHLRMPFL